jgi:PAS domain-containing protein
LRSEAEKTQLLQQPVWHHPRVHLLDDTWLLTIVAILIATALPWFASGFEVDVGMAAWGLLVLGGIHVAFALLGSPSRTPGRWHGRVLTLLCLAGVAAIGFIWAHAGALRNPVFPMVFALPVVSSIFLSRWHPYLLAAAGVLVTAVVALSQSPELRWFAAGLVGSDLWLSWLFGAQNTAPQATFTGFYAPSSYVVLLEVFAVLLFACAFAAEYLGSLFERLNARSVMAQAETERAQALWAGLIERLPVPVLLVDPDTLRIVAASELAQTAFLIGEASVEDCWLFDALRFSYPEIVQELVAGNDGSVPRTVLHVGEQVRMCEVRVIHIAHKGRRLALLTLQDVTELFHARTVLDSSEYAALLIDGRGCILTFNTPATALFGELEVGMDASRLLQMAQGAPLWWEPGLSGRSKLHLEIGPRLFQVTSSAVVLPGEEHRVFSVSLVPVARAEANDPYGVGSTRRMSVLRPIR